MTEKPLKELTADQIIDALVVNDEMLKEFEDELIANISTLKNSEQSQSNEIKMIVEIRNKMQLTQAQFAEILGVSASAVKSWEQGKRQPSGATQKLIQLLSIHPELINELTA